jgi:hypothetical protein
MIGASALTAISCFGLGVLLLLGWTYFTTENPRSNALLLKSLWLLVLPAAALIALPDRIFAWALGMWFAILLEECLKAYAARSEQQSSDRFALVALFGIWELMLAKPLWALTGGQVPEGWGRWEVFGLVLAAVVPVLMHVVTATIYAFHFRGRLWAALLSSWVVHITYNEATDLFGIAPLASVGKLIVLATILLIIWPNADRNSVERRLA